MRREKRMGGELRLVWEERRGEYVREKREREKKRSEENERCVVLS